MTAVHILIEAEGRRVAERHPDIRVHGGEVEVLTAGSNFPLGWEWLISRAEALRSAAWATYERVGGEAVTHTPLFDLASGQQHGIEAPRHAVSLHIGPDAEGRFVAFGNYTGPWTSAQLRTALDVHERSGA